MDQFESGQSDNLRLGSNTEVARLLYDLGEHRVEFSDAVGICAASESGIPQGERAGALALTPFALYCLEESLAGAIGERWSIVHTVQMRCIERVTWDPDGRTIALSDLDTSKPPLRIRCSEESGRRFHLHSKLRRFFEEEVFQPLPSMVAACNLQDIDSRRRLLSSIRAESVRLRLSRAQVESLSSLIHQAASAAASAEDTSAENALLGTLASSLASCASAADADSLGVLLFNTHSESGDASPLDLDVTWAAGVGSESPGSSPSPVRLAFGSLASTGGASVGPGGVRKSQKEAEVMRGVAELEEMLEGLDAQIAEVHAEGVAVAEAVVREEQAAAEVRRRRDAMCDKMYWGTRAHCRQERRHLYASEKQGRSHIVSEQRKHLAAFQLRMMREAAKVALSDQECYMSGLLERLNLARYDRRQARGGGGGGGDSFSPVPQTSSVVTVVAPAAASAAQQRQQHHHHLPISSPPPRVPAHEGFAWGGGGGSPVVMGSAAAADARLCSPPPVPSGVAGGGASAASTTTRVVRHRIDLNDLLLQEGRKGGKGGGGGGALPRRGPSQEGAGRRVGGGGGGGGGGVSPRGASSRGVAAGRNASASRERAAAASPALTSRQQRRAASEAQSTHRLATEEALRSWHGRLSQRVGMS